MALPALATPEQLAAWMQVEPGALPVSVASTLDIVSAIVRAESRCNFVRATTTLSRRPRDRAIALPLRPVVAVSEVTRDGVPLKFDWDEESERLYVDACQPVRVTFTYGHAEVPGDVLAVVLTAAARVVTNPGDLRQETVGSMSVTYASETIGAALSPADKDLLARYRRTAGMVRTR